MLSMVYQPTSKTENINELKSKFSKNTTAGTVLDSHSLKITPNFSSPVSMRPGFRYYLEGQVCLKVIMLSAPSDLLPFAPVATGSEPLLLRKQLLLNSPSIWTSPNERLFSFPCRCVQNNSGNHPIQNGPGTICSNRCNL